MSIASCAFNFITPPRLSQLTDISREEFLAPTKILVDMKLHYTKFHSSARFLNRRTEILNGLRILCQRI